MRTLRGMYAIALHDERRTGWCCRATRSASNNSIWQTERLRVRLGTAGAVEPAPRAAIDPRRRAELAQLKFTTGAETVFPGVRRLLPGEACRSRGRPVVPAAAGRLCRRGRRCRWVAARR